MKYLFVFLFLFANYLQAHTIVAHKARLKLKPIVDRTTSGEPFGVVVSAEVPAKGQIEFLDDSGELAARPFPVEIQVVNAGANITIWSFEDNPGFLVWRSNGLAVSDLLGRYWGARTGFSIPGVFGLRGTVWKNNRSTALLLSGTRPRGLSLDVLSISHLYVSIDGDAERRLRSDLPGSWDSAIELR